MSSIAIVTPHHKSTITNDENISLSMAKKKFNDYDKFFLIPDNIKINFDTGDYIIKKVDSLFLSSHREYNKFLLNKKFYNLFKKYDYILIFQLDCLFLKNKENITNFFCIDYVGSPHINKKTKRFNGVLNGGFSLRKVNSFLDVLNSNKINLLNFKIYQIRYLLSLRRFTNFFNFLTTITLNYYKNIFIIRKKKSLSQIFIKNFHKYYNEDVFWSIFPNIFNKRFNLPNFHLALSFGFDKDPKELYLINDNKIPLGCHSWHINTNKLFWRNIIKKIKAK